jgi:hypothetical protein
MYVTTMISRMDFLRPTRSAMGAATQHPYPTQSEVKFISIGYSASANNELPQIGEGVQDGSEIRRYGVFLSRLVVGTESLDKC